MTTTAPETDLDEVPGDLEYKTAPAAEAAVGTPVEIKPEGIIKAVVSVTGVVDEVKDVIEPGAYTDTLRKRRPKVIRNHVWNEQVGRVLDIEEYPPGDPRLPKETKDGRPWPKDAGALVATMQYNMATKRGRDAFEDVRFYHDSKEAEFSIGYQVPPGASTRGRDGVRRIKRLELFEISDVLFGAASLSMSLDVKNRMSSTDPASSDDDGEPDGEEPDEQELAALHAAAAGDPEFTDATTDPAGQDPEPGYESSNGTGPDSPTGYEGKRKFTAAERAKAAKEGAALKGGGFPINNAEDLANAIAALGRAKNKFAARRHIIKRAKALGLLDKLPADWPGSKKKQTKSADPGVPPLDPVSGTELAEHVYFPAGDHASCECGLPAEDELHTDEPHIKALYTTAETWFETKAADTHPGGGGVEALRRWYLNPAKSKIPWGKPGSWAKCVRIAEKHMLPEQAKGWCANLHHLATGTWPGPKAHGGGHKSAESPEAFTGSGPVGFEAGAALEGAAFGIEEGAGQGEIVAGGTFAHRPGCQAASQVGGPIDGVKMRGVHAGADPAQMVQVDAGGDRSNERGVNKPVGGFVAPGSVAVGKHLPGPRPAGAQLGGMGGHGSGSVDPGLHSPVRNQAGGVAASNQPPVMPLAHAPAEPASGTGGLTCGCGTDLGGVSARGAVQPGGVVQAASPLGLSRGGAGGVRAGGGHGSDVNSGTKDFSEDQPRDARGRWISIGDRIQISAIAGGGMGTVRGISGANLDVERDDGTRLPIARGYVEVLPDSGAPGDSGALGDRMNQMLAGTAPLGTSIGSLPSRSQFKPGEWGYIGPSPVPPRKPGPVNVMSLRTGDSFHLTGAWEEEYGAGEMQISGLKLGKRTLTITAGDTDRMSPSYGEEFDLSLPLSARVMLTRPVPENKAAPMTEWDPGADIDVKHAVGPGCDDSLEARREAVRAAVTDALSVPGQDQQVLLLGTWPDQVVAARSAIAADGTSTEEAFSFSYTVTGGTVELGDPEPIAIGITAAHPAAGDGYLHAAASTCADEAAFIVRLLAGGGENKAGRVLSGVNTVRLQQAVTALIAVLAAAGVEIVPPSAKQITDAQQDEGARPGGGGAPVITPDTTSPQAREGKTARAWLYPGEIATGLAVLADTVTLGMEAGKALGPRWDEARHPRDARGLFIEVGGKVKIGAIAGGGTGTVIGRDNGNRILVRRDGEPGGSPGTAFDPRHLTMTSKADGTPVAEKPAPQAVFKPPPALPVIVAAGGGGPGGGGKPPQQPPEAPSPPSGRQPRPDFDVIESGGKWSVKAKSTGHTLSGGHASREEAVAASDKLLTDAEYDAHVQAVSSFVKDNMHLATEKQHALGEDPETGRFAWSPERAEIHKQIANDLIEAAVAKGVPNDRKAIMSGGLGGSGKGTVLRSPEAGIDKSQYFTIDPDEFKAELIKRGLAPQVEGISPMEGAGLIHEESSELAMVAAELAYARGMNVIWDITMNKNDSVRTRLDALNRHGYETEAVYVDIPVETSVQRALGRHRTGVEAFRSGASTMGGRYVPPEIIRKASPPGGPPPNSINRGVFDAFKDQFARYSVWNNEGPGGPRKIEEK